MVRSALLRASRTMRPQAAILRDAAERPLLRMRSSYVAKSVQTFSNGTSILLLCSSHAGTGKFFERMKSGLNSFDW
jgi:hypothetical protein